MMGRRLHSHGDKSDVAMSVLWGSLEPCLLEGRNERVLDGEHRSKRRSQKYLIQSCHHCWSVLM